MHYITTLEDRCSEDPLDFPSSLRRLADDVHRHTWFVQRGTSLGQEKVIATLRGTRPGSPVADIGFNLLMSDILQELEERIRADETISNAGSEYPVTLPPVTWVDDLAVPVATSFPGDLEKVITSVLQHIHETFYSRGLQINYDKGKTEVVVMHRGAEADQWRRNFFSFDAETYITTSTSSHVFRVRAVPSYKHLAIRFQMDADLEHEISCRSAMARTAFHEVRRQIFRNQSLPVRTRITLLHSLVFSKLFYGCGSWYEIPRRVVARLDGIMIRFYRSVVDKGFWNASHTTDEELRAQHALPTFRVHLAVARLRYFQHVVIHDHDFHRSLLLEERTHNKGWLLEVEDDLTWMRECADLPDLPTTPTNCAEWSHFFEWFRTVKPPWKLWLKRAMKMHFLREGMANECKHFHADVINVLKDYGATIHEPVAPTEGYTSHACPECQQLFQSSTAVAVHRAKKHGIKAQIPALVQSAVCPGCLKFMWTSARVIQHLRYRPNRCLDRVSASRIPKEPFAVELPDHLRRVKRLPCAREHHGPLLPLPHEKERVEMRERLRACEDHGAKYDYWSKVNPALTMMAASKFTTAANHWLAMDPDNGEELYSALLEAMARLPYPERVQEKCLIHWIEFSMWDACLEWPPAALERLEKEHQHILANLPIWTLRTEREQLQRMLQSDAPPVGRIPQPQGHQPHPSKHKRAQAVGTSYTDLEQMELHWRAMVFTHTPTPRIPSMSDNVFYIIHLYSGRRRLHDLQWQMEQLLGPWNGRIKVISIDTAVHSMCDINDPVFWNHILSLAKSGYLLDGTTVRNVERGETRSFVE